MQGVAIIEFWLLALSTLVLAIIVGLLKKEHRELVDTRVALEKAKASADYANALMELKDAANAELEKKNKILNTGSKSEQLNAAAAILCNASKKD